MAQQITNKLKRLYIIVNRLQYRRATRQELMDLLAEHGLNISKPTFERDKRSLKDDFGIELIADQSDYSYSLDYISKEDLAQIIQFLQYHQLSSALNNNLTEGKSALKVVDFENEYQLKGIEFLDRLFLATKQHQYIELHHRKFNTPKVIKHKIKPHLLKQYQSRWYVIGENKKNNLRSFGIDRIESLKLLDETFKPDSKDYRESFTSCIGISNAQKPKMIMRLQFNRHQKHYLETLPLHTSQELVEETNTQVVFEYLVVDNFELRQQILKYGSLVKVLAPTSLVEGIKHELQKAVKQYL